jgi:hypothetical protein
LVRILGGFLPIQKKAKKVTKKKQIFLEKIKKYFFKTGQGG